jgi:microcystin-dependent protein
MAFIGNILLFAGTKLPQGFMFCDGSLISKDDYPALFNLIGTTYGGDGKPKFAVPNLNLRVPIGTGKENERPDYGYAESGGKDQYMIAPASTPAHNHQLTGRIKVYDQEANAYTPKNNFFSYSTNDKDYRNTADGTMAENLIEIELMPSSDHPVQQKAINNMQPYIAINYIICVGDDYPYPSHG